MTRQTISNGHWFDEDAAIKFDGYREWDGSNMYCIHGGGQWGGCALHYTRSGNWIKEAWYNGSGGYEQVSESEAVQWLVNNNDHQPEGLPKKATDRVNKIIDEMEV